MKALNINYLSKVSFLGLFLLSVVLFSCKKDQNNYPQQPDISVNGETRVFLKPGAPVSVTVNFEAPGPGSRLQVNKNGGPYRSIRLNTEATSFVFAEENVSASAVEGDSIKYEFVITNDAIQNRSAIVTYVVNVAVYDTIDIGTNQLYKVTVPTNGIVSAGSVKFASGRKYFVESSLVFSSGTSLNVDAGAEVYFNTTGTSLCNVTIEAGAQVNIGGTATRPVVMTSDKTLRGTQPAANDWGVFNIRGEGNGSNSGSIRYLRLEYGTTRSFRLQDVGAGTTIDYVQVYKSGIDGVMATNGDVNMSHIIATDCGGSGFRLGDGYAGNMQFIISSSSVYFAELDEFTVRENASPRIANLTVLGPGRTGSNTHGMRLRAASAAKIYNSIVADFPRRGLRLNDQVVTSNLNGPTVFAYSFVFNVPTDPYREDRTGGTNPFAGSFTGGVASNPFFNNVSFDGSGLRSLAVIEGIGVNDFIPNSAQTSAFNPLTLNSFFQAATFVGAVQNAANDWTLGWTRNAGGNIRTAN